MSDPNELVARYDADGSVVGTASRGEMRARGLWHASSMVLVRSCDGREVYVHRRTTDKDVFPGLHDCWAGGVVGAGETPAECARRELAEELGITGVTPVMLFTSVFDRPPHRCHNFVYEVRWDGPVTHQPEEIADGGWMSIPRLRAWADDPDSPLVPDGRLTIREWFERESDRA